MQIIPPNARDGIGRAAAGLGRLRGALFSSAAAPGTPASARASMHRQVRVGLAAIALIGGTATAWAALAKLDSAIVAQGVVAVEGSVKRMQHPTGGVVGKLLVKEGQRVAVLTRGEGGSAWHQVVRYSRSGGSGRSE